MGAKEYLGKIKKWPRDLAGKIKSFFVQGYFCNAIILWLLALSFLVNIINIVSLAIWVKPVDFPIILHYNVYFGVDVLNSWEKVYIMPLIGLFLFIVNTLLGLYFYKNKERIASHVLAIVTLMIQLSLLVASVGIILINY